MTAGRPPRSEATDRELMQSLSQGEPAALAALIEAYWRPLLSYAVGLLGNGDEAEDIVQETFVRVWQRRSSWRPVGSVRAYLYRITRNLALNLLRAERSRVHWTALETQPDKEPTPEQALEGRELEAAVERAVANLPARRREVFLLARFHNLSYAEIAELMEISPQTVANQMSSALAELRTALGSYLER